MPCNVRLIAITDTTVADEELLLQRAEQLCASSVSGSIMIQWRDRELCMRERLRLGKALARITQAHSQVFCVNDRADLALALEATGLHLGESSVSAARVRARFPSRFWLTRASHSPEACQSMGADAVLLSPICSPRKGAASLGLGGLKRACERADVPIFALGGVDANNAHACIEAGAAGVAAIGAWLACESLTPLVNALGIARLS